MNLGNVHPKLAYRKFLQNDPQAAHVIVVRVGTHDKIDHGIPAVPLTNMLADFPACLLVATVNDTDAPSEAVPISHYDGVAAGSAIPDREKVNFVRSHPELSDLRCRSFIHIICVLMKF